jgi:hypothetical protein
VYVLMGLLKGSWGDGSRTGELDGVEMYVMRSKGENFALKSQLDCVCNEVDLVMKDQD